MNIQFINPERWFKNAQFKLLENIVLQGVTIPNGFISDGASVPRWLPFLGLLLIGLGHYSPWFFIPGVLLVLTLAIFPRFGQSLNAAVLHDYLLKQDISQWHHATGLFLTQLKRDGVKPWRRYTMASFITIWQAFFAVIRFIKNWHQTKYLVASLLIVLLITCLSVYALYAI